MTEPIAAAVAAGGAAALLTTLGIEPAPLFWALVGAVIGLSAASPTTRLRAVGTFVAVVFASSKIGSYFALRLLHGDVVAPSILSLGVAAFYHPIYQQVASRVPAIVGRWLDRLPGANSEPKQ